ncbi:probable protein arginine N-methyltransferase 6 isoform X2 [Physcomitrium patens]|uniref:probable protein arginine N-methyltransferase 6 isoform X2 n=1 Tax=Physcomitrium patens TaxID=3218 RepID=UPI003CCD076A
MRDKYAHSRRSPSGFVLPAPPPVVVAPKEGVVASSFLDQDRAYFHAYSHVGIHEEMIKDRARTDAYRDAIFFHADYIRDKVVMDVGCGTGILSIFCAYAGARKVHAVDASAIAVQAREVVKANNLSDVITVHHGRVEDLQIFEEVDVIVSEWMGYMLLYELYMAPITNAEKYSECIDFWRSVYGIDMSAMLPLAKQCSFEEPCIETVPAESVLSWPIVIKQIDCNTVTVRELETVKADFSVSSIMMAPLHGFCIWFDVSFGTRVLQETDLQSDSSLDSSFSGENDNNGNSRTKKRANPSDCIVLSTAPDSTPTHWAQTILYVYDPIEVKQDQEISGSIELSQSKENPRFLNIHLKYRSGNRECVKESVMR